MHFPNPFNSLHQKVRELSRQGHEFDKKTSAFHCYFSDLPALFVYGCGVPVKLAPAGRYYVDPSPNPFPRGRDLVGASASGIRPLRPGLFGPEAGRCCRRRSQAECRYRSRGLYPYGRNRPFLLIGVHESCRVSSISIACIFLNDFYFLQCRQLFTICKQPKDLRLFLNIKNCFV